jgi:hypothetical protein
VAALWRGQPGAGIPLGSGVQVPTWPVIAHDAHGPQDATGQQTPSVQWPLMHSLSSAHAELSGCRLVHDPPRQLKLLTQASSPTQVVRQLPAPHT